MTASYKTVLYSVVLSFLLLPIVCYLALPESILSYLILCCILLS